jgi:hypothetical protein
MGIFDKIKGAFSKGAAVVNTIILSEFDQVIANSRIEYARGSTYFWSIKLNSISVYSEQVANWDDKKKIDLIVYCLVKINEYTKSVTSFSSTDINYQNNGIREAYLSQLFKTKLSIDEEDLDKIVTAFCQNKKWRSASLSQWPVASFLNQLDRQYGKTGLSEKMVRSLDNLKADLKKINQIYDEKEKLKLIEKIDQLIFSTKETGLVKPTLFLGADAFSTHANEVIQALPAQEQQIWYQLIAKAQKATGSKPSNKYLLESKALFKELGADKFKSIVNNWFLFVINLKEVTKEHRTSYGDRDYVYYSSTFLSTINTEAIKGFVWICSNFHDSATLNNLAKLAERCYKKMAGVGPAAAAVGNACLYALYKSKGLDGIGHLSRLKLRIKQSSTQQIIEKYIQEAAKEQGVSTHEIEDMAVDDFGLVNGTREFQFDNFTSVLKITGVGKSELNWYKADGVQQKAVPAAVKEKQAAKLKKAKDIQKQVDQTTSAQRDRVDRLFRTGRQMKLDDFKAFFLDHGLMSFLTNKIIWNITQNGQTVSVMRMDDQWVNNKNESVTADESSLVYLWHPAAETIAEVKKWRDFLIQHQIQQPLKQAFREIYLLTEAEVNTRSYSNRMAAHVLKQHQFNMLAKTRGWKYSLLGAYDNGVNSGIAQINLPEHQLKAEYWVNEVNADDAFNDTGIWNYVTTDQVRFLSTATNEVVDLIDVPVLPLSEVLRDVDLFVGVASVGNDPTWQDSGGLPALNNYWTSYSFGDLSEVAKNRKEILLGLIPRLKISSVSTVQDKFLVVKGKLRTYKIHIGSTNILMEPNDQYLCIVPDLGMKSHTEDLFIPFEGDSGLSVILSKAFLLADDDKITDKTITSQINRK